MEQNQPQRKGGSALITFILVLIILFLSGILIYLRYGDLIMNRLYQFTDGRVGAETGVTSLPGRDDGANASEPDDVDASGGQEGVNEPDGASEPGDIEVEAETDSVPEPVGDVQAEETVDTPDNAMPLDYAAVKALPDGITLSTHDFTVRTLGESVTLRVTGGSNGPFVWVSENPDVAAVDANGTITARSHGTVNVIVTDGVKKGTCIARMITGATSTSAKLNTSDFTRTVEEGSYQLSVSGVSAPITWTSENPAVATVDANGLVTPVAKGRTQIRAAWDGGYLMCIVRVPG